MDYKLKAESGSFSLQGSDVTFTVSKFIEKVELNDRLSELERYKIIDWAKEHYENLDGAIGNLEKFSKAFIDGLNGKISNETIDWILQLISSLN